MLLWHQHSDAHVGTFLPSLMSLLIHSTDAASVFAEKLPDLVDDEIKQQRRKPQKGRHHAHHPHHAQPGKGGFGMLQVDSTSSPEAVGKSKKRPLDANLISANVFKQILSALADLDRRGVIARPDASTFTVPLPIKPIDVCVYLLLDDNRAKRRPYVQDYDCKVRKVNITQDLSFAKEHDVHKDGLKTLSLQPLQDLGKFVSTKIGGIAGTALAALGELPFDVSAHPSAKSHVAKEMLERLGDDLDCYKDMTEKKKTATLACDLADNTVPYTDKVAFLNQVQAATEMIKQRDQRFIASAFAELDAIANKTPDNDEVATLLYTLDRYTGLESRITNNFTVLAILTNDAAATFQRTNPFMTPGATTRVLDLTILILLYILRSGQTNRVLKQTRELLEMVGTLQVGVGQSDVNGTDEEDLLPQLVQTMENVSQEILTSRAYMDASTFEFDPKFLVRVRICKWSID